MRERMPYLVRLGTLAFWAPSLTIDLVLLRQGQFSPESMTLVFWLLFREAVVFLALWFGAGLIQALLFGRTERRARRRAGWDSPSTSVLVPNREHRRH